MGIVERARELAHRAHAGQTDKAGRPYIEHVARVAAAVAGEPEAEAVAWMHDVLEDCRDRPEFDRVFDFPHDIALACVQLNRHASGSAADYYAGIRSSPIALRVKLADIADNSDPERLAQLDEATATRLKAKYADAIEALTGNKQKRARS